jgi:hypothetical protein
VLVLARVARSTRHGHRRRARHTHKQNLLPDHAGRATTLFSNTATAGSLVAGMIGGGTTTRPSATVPALALRHGRRGRLGDSQRTPHRDGRGGPAARPNRALAVGLMTLTGTHFGTGSMSVSPKLVIGTPYPVASPFVRVGCAVPRAGSSLDGDRRTPKRLKPRHGRTSGRSPETSTRACDTVRDVAGRLARRVARPRGSRVRRRTFWRGCGRLATLSFRWTAAGHVLASDAASTATATIV